jgi:hypothetical protein
MFEQRWRVKGAGDRFGSSRTFTKVIHRCEEKEPARGGDYWLKTERDSSQMRFAALFR